MTQNETVLHHLKQYGSITDLEAYDKYAIRRLGARIWDLRDAGHKIKSKTTKGVNRFGAKTMFTTYYYTEDTNEHNNG